MTNELRIKYNELTGYVADKRWSLDRLQNEVAAHEAKRAEAAALKAEEDAKRAAAQAARDARKLARGPLMDWLQRGITERFKDDEYRFYSLVAAAQRAVNVFPAEANTFAEKFVKDPAYTLSWGNGYFELAAKYQVSKEIITYFEAGLTWADWERSAKEKVLQMARNLSRSTSPTSNLMDDHIMKTYAGSLDYFW